MGNGAKAEQKRARNLKTPAKKTDTSQRKANEQSKSIICHACKQPFMITTREPALLEHVSSKHSGKTNMACFPDQFKA